MFPPDVPVRPWVLSVPHRLRSLPFVLDGVVRFAMGDGGTLAFFSHHADDVCTAHEERVGDATSVTNRVASATAALDRLTAVCYPVTRDGAALQDPALLLTCYRSTARAAEPRDVVVRNALGTQSLTAPWAGARCGLPARDVAASD